MNEGFINEVNGNFVSADERVPLFRVDVIYGGEHGTGLDLVVLNQEFLNNERFRKIVFEDLRNLFAKVENHNGQQ